MLYLERKLFWKPKIFRIRKKIVRNMLLEF